MDAHFVLSIIACIGHLAFAALIWWRRGRSPLATPLVLLFLDAFAWLFADLAHSASSSHEWHRVDRFFSSFMPILALQVVVTFVGRARSLRGAMRLGYVLSALLALGGALSIGFVPAPLSELWWKVLLLAGAVAMLVCVTLLLAHRRRSIDRDERARSELILWAVAFGTLLGSTDLWFDEVDFDMPRFGNLGMLLALGLVATDTLRLRLLGREVPPLLGFYAIVVGTLGVIAYFAALRFLARGAALWVLAAVTMLVVGVAMVREFGRAAAVTRERTRRLTLLGRFSDQLAHDLRNPLSALKGALQFLTVEKEQGRSLDAQAEFLELMREQVERMQNVVENYQRMAKVEPVLRLDSINDVVRDVVQLQRFATASDVKLELELATDLPSCKLDRELIATTLENILRNACEAMPRGGTVKVRTAQSNAGDAVLLCVQDEGNGMDTRELERATDEFFTTKAGGTGLGLNFAARVARAHGGSLSLSSVTRRGTSVSLSIPAGA
jgi:two-component system, NtrC family, sensor histidine kinase HydH